VLLRGGKFTVTLHTADGQTVLKVSDGKTEKEVAADPVSRDLWHTVEFNPAAEGLELPPAGVPWYAFVGRNPVYEIELL